MMTKREFLGSAPCAALGSFGVVNSLLNLRLINNATAAPSDPNDYKALVCFFLFGGNDSYNMLVPTSTSEYSNYQAIRSNLALPQVGNPDGLLPLNTLNTPGRTFGLHPSMPNLQALYNSGDAAFMANVGTLVERSTITEARNNAGNLPGGLFAHNSQQRIWQTSIADNLSATTGWGGRLGDRVLACNSSNAVSMNISLSGNQICLVGDDTISYSISRNGATVLSGLNSSNSLESLRAQASQSLVDQQQRNLFIRAFNGQKKTSYESAQLFANGFNSANISTTVDGNLQAVARTIKARQSFGHNRQIFFVGFNGWDSHANLLRDHVNLLSNLDRSIQQLWSALGELGVQDNVTIFSASDFGRTIRSNGLGTDHGWAGNSFMIGGAVKGQRIYGDYPDPSDLTIGSGLDVGTNGRYLPTTSVDEYLAEMALWFGMPPSELENVLPNIGNFYSYSPSTPPIGFLL